MKKQKLIRLSFLSVALILISFKNNSKNDFGPEIKDIDGNTYSTVKIGNQNWMVGNLNVGHFRNGVIIQEAKTNEEWIKASKEHKPAWCYYKNDTSAGKKFGKLYNWFAINDESSICPEGWHISTSKDWEQIQNLFGKANCNKLKSKTGWSKSCSLGNNESGFAGLPGGRRTPDGEFEYESDGLFWCSNQFGPMTEMAWSYRLGCNGNFNNGAEEKGEGQSVRCVKD